MVATNSERVALLLNGKPMAEKPVDKYEMVTFEVPYEAGTLEARASNGSKEVARFVVETTGAPAAIRLIPDRERMTGDGNDAQPITVLIVDTKGRVVPTADLPVAFSVSGPAAIIGLNNGDPTNHEPEKGSQHSTYRGLAQVIVQSKLDGLGKFTLHAVSPGLVAADASINVVTSASPPVMLMGGKGHRF
jgi:beta-galactosidase